MTARQVKEALASRADAKKAAFYPRFFKTGKGEYGEGDRFVGVVVPEQRRIARQFRDLPLPQVRMLLRSRFHEHRLTAVFILTLQYERGDAARRETLVRFLLENLRALNNWDLVDAAAPKILGPQMLAQPGETRRLARWARSSDLWERRIAMLCTYPFIRAGRFDHALAVAETLLGDEHDLIHKAVGWMLREVGNQDVAVEKAFLDRHAASMPRTALRYAIEKFSPQVRARYLKLGR